MLSFGAEYFIFQFDIQKSKDIQNYNFAYCNGCETWSLTFKEERRLDAFENMVLRRVSGLKWDKVMGVEKAT